MADLELLVKRAQKDDQSAFVELIHLCEKSLYRVAKAVLRNDEDCADAIQEAILQAYQKLDQLRKPKYFQTWITRILVRKCYRILEQRKKVTHLSDTQTNAIPALSPYGEVELRDLVEQLEQPLRLVFTLHYLEDYSLRQIAEVTEIPEGTIKSRLYRARRTLMEFFEAKEVQTI